MASLVLITASQVLPRWLGRHDRSERDRPQVTIEQMAVLAQPEISDEPESGQMQAAELEALPEGAPAATLPAPTPEEALDALVRKGVLRRATLHDYDEWRAADGAEPDMAVSEDGEQSSLGDPYVFHGYVVQAEMEFPDGLYGAHQATFIVPRGVPVPTGNRGHSRVLDMNP